MTAHLSDIRPYVVAALATLLLSLALAAPASAPASGTRACQAAGVRPPHAAKRSVAHAIVCLINIERAKHGLRPLRLSKRLTRAGRRHVLDMARFNYFSHDGRRGSSFVDRIMRAGYTRGAHRWYVGENLVWGSGDRTSPRASVEAWMNSPPHRANILRPKFRHIGLGVAYDTPVRGLRGAIYAAEFGVKR
jgi:uncharacterized protein YkwD